MTQNEITETKVWRINDNTLVVAGTIPLAIEIFETKYYTTTVEKVELIRGKWDNEYALILENYNNL